MAVKKSAQFKDWLIEIEESGAVKVSASGEVVSNTKSSLREISAAAGMIVEEKWNTQQHGAKLVKFLTESAPQAPVSATKVEVQPKVKIPEVEAALKAAKKAKTQAEAEAKAAKEELARIQAEAEKAKKEVEAAKAALEKTKREAEALKTVAEKVQKTDNKSFMDPFDGLMVRIPPGLFHEEWRLYEGERLVYPNGDRRRKPEKENIFIYHKRSVSISYNFSICKYPVSQLQWKLIMGKDNNPSDVVGDDLPITHITFDDIQVFIKRLNQLTGKQYRLPTFAEYVWAARGAKDYGRFIEERYHYDIPFKQLKQCNEKGLFFYAENEFCEDFWESLRNWKDDAVVNPLGPKEVKPITTETPSGLYAKGVKLIPPTEGLPRVIASYYALKNKDTFGQNWTLQNVVDWHAHILFRLVLQ